MEIKKLALEPTEFQIMFANAPEYDAVIGTGKFDLGGKKVLITEATAVADGATVSGDFCFIQNKTGGPGKMISRIEKKTGTTDVYEIVCYNEAGQRTYVDLKQDVVAEVATAISNTVTANKTAIKKVLSEKTINPRAGKTFSSAPVAPVVTSGMVNVSWYDIELPPVKHSKDKIPARVVVARHPGDPDKKSLYLISDKTGFSLHDTTRYAEPEKLINEYGAQVIHKIYYDKKGNLKIRVYEAKEKLARGRVKALASDPKSFADWIEKDNTAGGAGYPSKAKAIKVMTKGSKVVLGLVASAVILGSVAGTLAFVGQDQSELAFEFGEDNANNIIKSGKPFFFYRDGKPISADEMFNPKTGVFAQGIENYRQNSVFGFAKDYSDPTIQGFAFAVGAAVANELNGTEAELYKIDETGNYSIQYYFPHETQTGELGASWNNPFTIEENFKAYLSNLGYSDADIDLIVDSYKLGFESNVKENIIEEGKIGSEAIPEIPVEPEFVVDFDSLELKSAIADELTDSVPNKSYTAEDVDIFYASEEGTSMWATAGSSLYYIDLEDGKIVSNEDLLERVDNAVVTEAVKASNLFRNVELAESKIFEMKQNLGADELYVANYELNDDWTVTPDLIYVKNGGATIVVEQMDPVKVKPGCENVASIIAMNAYSVFGLDQSGNYMKNTAFEGETTIFDDNALIKQVEQPVLEEPVSETDLTK